MPFLIVEALVPVKYSRVRVLSLSGVPLPLLFGFVTYYMSLDMQFGYTVS